MSDRPLVTIITVNFNQPEVTFQLLDSIRNQDYSNVQVIVVDNGSYDKALFDKTSLYPEVQFIRSEQNLGFAGGNNLALPHAKGEFLFFVNNDAEITPICIEKLVRIFNQYPDTGMVSPLICYYPEPGAKPLIQYAGMTQVNPFTGRNTMIGNGVPNNGQYKDTNITAYAHGAAMMIPTAVLAKVGAMYEAFFLYYEELDWCERIRRQGLNIRVVPAALIYHKESLTVNNLGALKTYYLNRNRRLFMARNFTGWRYAIFLVFLHLVTVPKHLVQYLLKGEWANIKPFLKGTLGF